MPHRDDYTYEEEQQVLLDLEEKEYEEKLIEEQETDIQERLGHVDPMEMCWRYGNYSDECDCNLCNHSFECSGSGDDNE